MLNLYMYVHVYHIQMMRVFLYLRVALREPLSKGLCFVHPQRPAVNYCD